MERWLVTGAGRGIGAEIVRQLLARGDAVFASVRDVKAAERLVKETASNHSNGLRTLTFDVRDGRAIAEAAKSLEGSLDVLVNNAGVIGPEHQSALDMDFDGFLDTFAVNTLGPLRTAQAFLPHLLKGKRPRIVTVSSSMGSMSYEASDHAAYRASKAAANKIVQCLATDLAAKGVTVIAAHPGWVRTAMGGKAASISVDESARGLISLIDRLQADNSGSFLDYRGQKLPW